MDININERTDSLSEELLSILYLAESRHGSFNDFIFLEKPHHRTSPDENDHFLTASTVRIEGNEVVKGYAVWDGTSLENNTDSWNKVSPHIIGLEWYNRNSPNDMARIIDKISSTL